MTTRNTFTVALPAAVTAAALSGALAFAQCDRIDLAPVSSAGVLGLVGMSLSADGDRAAVFQVSGGGAGLRRWSYGGGLGAGEPLPSPVGSSLFLNRLVASADSGVVAVEVATFLYPEPSIVRYSPAAGGVSIGSLGGGWTQFRLARLLTLTDFTGSPISLDGDVIVGSSRNAAGEARAFRWDPTGGMVELGVLAGGESGANAVSSDGSVVVGVSGDATLQRAFRWTAATGMVEIAALPSGVSSRATHVSGDGEVVFGSYGSPATAFRWTAAGGLQPLGPSDPSLRASVVAVSSDGSVVIGVVHPVGSLARVGAFTYTAQHGFRSYMDPAGPLGLSDLTPDGRLAVGSVGGFGNAGSGFILDVATGVREAVGADSLEAISADGNTVAGYVGFAPALWNLDGIGVTYCDPLANSSGCTARIFARGSDRVADADFSLVADNLPQNVFGIFVGSMTPSLTGSVPGNPSPLCVGGAITRFNRPGEIQSSGASGVFRLEVDLASIPVGQGTAAIAPGDTWHFQAWFRDGAGSNFTDAVALPFM